MVLFACAAGSREDCQVFFDAKGRHGLTQPLGLGLQSVRKRNYL
jgi:hypothetical protein